MNYYQSRLKRLSSKIKHNEYIGFDVETIGKYNKFYSGGLYFYDENNNPVFEYFTDKETMIKFMLSRKFRNKYIVATNLDFDLTVLFYGTKFWNKLKLLMRKGKIIMASYDLKNNNGKIRFIDTINYVFFSVEKLGKIIGEEKIKKPDFLGKRKPKNRLEFEIMKEYNMQDCKISCDFMYFLQKCINELGGTVKLTIASTAMQTWRMNYQPCNLLKESFVLDDESIRNFIFEGYYGGRTEVFKRGTFKDIYYYDVNSLYPSVMLKDFPLPQSVQKVDKPSINYINNFMGVSECIVSVPEYINKPLLPIKRNNKLIFPVGKFKGTWNNCELKKALDLGYNIKPLKQIIYTKQFKPFKNYVKDFYELRQMYKEENNSYEFVVKLLLNSLYGKFATKTVDKLKIIDLKQWDGDLEKLKKEVGSNEFDCKDGMIMIQKQEEFDGIYSFPILSSYVTSYSRLLMYEMLNNEDVIYTDTDSIVLTSKIYNDSHNIGELKLEGTFKTGTFIKPKFYLLDNEKVKIKGLNRATVEDFNNIIKGLSVSKTKFSRLKESVRRGMKPNQVMEITKSLCLEDNKRIWESEDLTKVSNSKPLVILENE